MLVRKKKQHVLCRNLTRKTKCESVDSEDNLQSVRSWIRKIEQTTTSVSSRLAAVEKRLSGGITGLDEKNQLHLQGPIETLLADGKKKTTAEVARVLDRELALLHNEVVEQQQQTNDLREHLGVIEQINMTVTNDLRVVQTATSQMNTTLEHRLKHTQHSDPFVMRVGALEIPIEFTGIIGGLLAFTIAVLVLINQKEILLSPVFLFLVGLVFLGFALVKMIHLRTRALVHPLGTTPIKASSAQLNSLFSERKDG